VDSICPALCEGCSSLALSGGGVSNCLTGIEGDLRSSDSDRISAVVSADRPLLELRREIHHRQGRLNTVAMLKARPGVLAHYLREFRSGARVAAGVGAC